MTVVQIFRRPEAANFGYDGLVADPGPSCCRVFRKVLGPPGDRFT